MAYLKKNHAYYNQVQGQVALTGYMWCNSAIWMEGKDGSAAHIDVEHISFDESFWEN